jgi:hypothetical protein
MVIVLPNIWRRSGVLRKPICVTMAGAAFFRSSDKSSAFQLVIRDRVRALPPGMAPSIGMMGFGNNVP